MQTVGDILRNPWLKLAVIVLLAALGIWFVYTMRLILTPFLLAFIMAYILNPAVDRLSGRWFPRTAATIVIMAIMIAVVAGVLGIIAEDLREAIARGLENPKVRQFDSHKLTDSEWIDAQVRDQIDHLGPRTRPIALRFYELMREHLLPRLQQAAQYIGSAIASLVASVVGFIIGIMYFVVFIVVTFYILRDFHTFLDTCHNYVPLNYRTDVVRIASQLDNDLRGFFRGQLMVAGILSIVYFIGLSLAGIPYAFPLAVLSGIGNIIPFFGLVVGISLGLIASLFAYGFDIHMIYVVIVYIAAHTFDASVVTPNLLGRNVGFNPAIVILALVVFGNLMGFFGILFAIPITSIIRIALKEVYSRIDIKKQIELAPENIPKDTEHPR
jgi:predicted PurR-regulated permease PerM